LKGWDGEPETRIVIIGLEQAGQAASEITRLLQQCAEPAADKRSATA
jgi:hypothetical protein